MKTGAEKVLEWMNKFYSQNGTPNFGEIVEQLEMAIDEEKLKDMKIPTAEEFLKKNIDYVLEIDAKNDVEEAMIEFAKLHVEQALKEASEKAKIKYQYNRNIGSQYCDEYVDKDSILNSYSIDNIK